MLNKLIRYTIENGLVTSLTGIVVIVCFQTQPDTCELLKSDCPKTATDSHWSSHLRRTIRDRSST
jgi:hypothetical protein